MAKGHIVCWFIGFAVILVVFFKNNKISSPGSEWVGKRGVYN